MALQLSLLVALLIFAVGLLALSYLFQARLRVERRLLAVTELRLERVQEGEASPLQRPLYERIVAPLLQAVGKMLQSWAPQALRTALARRVRAAGLEITAEQFAGWYMVAGACGACLFAFVAWLRAESTLTVLAASFAGGVVSAGLPELVLRQRQAERHTRIVRALPDVLDLLTVSVNAGLGFDSALMKVTEKMKGPLPSELGQVLHEIKMGVARRDALKALADRTGVEELRAFVSTIIQADQLGVSISKVLKLQSESLRQRRRQRAEEMALKAPIKMLFPLVFFIFPTLFIVLLGPALLQMLAGLTGM
ncbi:MAG: type II secretion system F family protein [Selenomonadales bacterium]|jgi:tight adherence protein C|nr:type II secretion system F family protein [Selenomonadales bacterium]